MNENINEPQVVAQTPTQPTAPAQSVSNNPVTINTQPMNNIKTNKAETHQTVNYLIYFFTGVLEVMFLFRLMFKLTGANPLSGFVSFIYGVTEIFVTPFTGIFPQATTTGAVTAAVLEPSTLVAMLVYAVVAWGMMMLVTIISGKKKEL